jgi:hypothetical protein
MDDNVTTQEVRIMSYIDELISILQAFKEGKTIQYRKLGFPEWCEASGDGWNFSGYEYRVKPEPREWWINVYPEYENIYNVYKTQADAEANKDDSTRSETIRVREVL